MFNYVALESEDDAQFTKLENQRQHRAPACPLLPRHATCLIFSLPVLFASVVLMCTQTCPEVKTSALDTAEKWEEVCRQTCIQAAFIRVAALWAEEVNGQ